AGSEFALDRLGGEVELLGAVLPFPGQRRAVWRDHFCVWQSRGVAYAHLIPVALGRRRRLRVALDDRAPCPRRSRYQQIATTHHGLFSPLLGLGSGPPAARSKSERAIQ